MVKGVQRASGYMPQLDSLRAIAVILVIISHWFSAENFLNRYTANGSLGVTLFFVLSGFLITGILLQSKIKIEEGNSLRSALKVFYIRRSLRIFPVYYVLLAVLLLIGIADVSKSFWWHFFYSSNFYFWINGIFEGQLSHFWSLAVEEQFYLLWPAIIFFIPRKFLPVIFFAGIVGAVLFRFMIVTPQNELGHLLMPGSLDSFCIGGLLAFGRQFSPKWFVNYGRWKNYFIFLSFILIIYVHTSIFKQLSMESEVALYYLLISIVFGIWIDIVADTVNTHVVGRVLSNKGLLYIGKISYSLYLFHNFVPYFYSLSIPGIIDSVPDPIIHLLRFAVLVGLSSLSWFLLEKPVLKLKSKFQFA